MGAERVDPCQAIGFKGQKVGALGVGDGRDEWMGEGPKGTTFQL